eukprot:TRINITY_DN11697_c0_g1_i1.p1 TRINITY_DN11697_c0_g1~~TRINITY_DN11697_c0_g1_i1.p1  ORF type:complete len:1011 (-),score=129.21 TRINITY_DN11697_c0_g1_i1:305-3337(-)
MAILPANWRLWTLYLLPVVIVQLERLQERNDLDGPSEQSYDASGHKLSLEDISTEDLVRALDPDTSPFWLAVVDAAAAHVSSRIPASSLLQFNESLVGQHHLVRRLWQKIGRSSDDKDVCATSVAELPKRKKSSRKLKADECDDDDATPSPQSPSQEDAEATHTAPASSQQATESTPAKKLLRAIKYLKTAGSFFTSFLRWDLTLTMFPVPNPVPVIGFKCQPFVDCFLGVIEFFKQVLKALKELIVAFGSVFYSMFASVRKWLPSGQHESPKSTGAPGNSAAGTEFNVNIPKGQEVSEKEFGTVIVDKESFASDVCLKLFRLKGSISLMSWGSNVKFMFGTIPLPLQKWKSDLWTCTPSLKKVYALFNAAMNPLRWWEEGKTLTDLYFGENQCNPHTVGLCMLVQKSRTCDFYLDANGVIQDNTRADKESFCRVFDGVKLGLTKSPKSKKVRCTGAVARKHLQNGTLQLSMSSFPEWIKAKSNFFDVGQGCRLVKKRLALTDHCDRPETDEDMFLRCRKLFGCSRDSQFETSLLKWEDYVGRVMDVITDAVPLLHRKATSKLVSERIDAVHQQGTEFKSQVDMTFFKPPVTHDLDPTTVFMHPTWRDECLIDLYPVEGSNGSSVMWANTKALIRKVKRELSDEEVRDVRRGLLGQHEEANKKLALPFFHRLSQGLKVDTWPQNKSECEHARLDEATTPQKGRELPAPTGLTQMMLKIDDASSGLQVDKTDEGEKASVTFYTPGWGSKRTVLKATRRAKYEWIVDECDGRHCNDITAGTALLSFRVQISNDEQVMESICKSGAQAVESISSIQGAAPNDDVVFRSESDFKRAASMLYANADIIEKNANIDVGDELEFPELVNWKELAELVDPKVNTHLTDDEYLRSRWSDGARNKLALFFRRRDWSFAKSKANGLITLLQHGEEASVGQIRALAKVLEKPRKGAVQSVGFAFHQLAVDLLTGMPQKVLLRGKTWDASDQLDILAPWLESLTVRDGGCRLALVNIEHSLDR